jgi:hypothetical protein
MSNAANTAQIIVLSSEMAVMHRESDSPHSGQTMTTYIEQAPGTRHKTVL